jgi:phosphoglycolate phosphatase
MIKTILFDLDGTLLNTLDDLSNSVNHALQQHGLPLREVEEIRMFVGNGVRKLVQRAVPNTLDVPSTEKVFATFQEHYLQHCYDLTKPYPGILDLLCQLRKQGIRTGIVSNKWHTAVEELNQRFFSGWIDVALGESNNMPRKPSPDMLWAAMKSLESTPETTLYVGDSDVDILTAKRAAISCVSVTWGFRDAEFLKKSGATLCIDGPLELLEYLSSIESIPHQ